MHHTLWKRFGLAAVLCLVLCLPVPAHSACAAKGSGQYSIFRAATATSEEGDLFYDTTAHALTYCDGTSWVTIGGVTMPATNNTVVGNTGATSLSGTGSVAIGYQAANISTSADSTVAIGYLALTLNTTADYNTAVGSLALRTFTGAGNTAVGYSALTGVTGQSTGTNNTAVGYSAAGGATTAIGSTALGAYALDANVTGNYPTALGYLAQRYMVATGTTGNTAVGYAAMQGNADGTSSTGTNNTALGSAALYTITSGSNNIAVGQAAQNKLTTGGSNIGIGVSALYSNTTGIASTAVGTHSQRYMVATGTTDNTALGHGAMAGNADGTSSTGLRNTAVGSVALYTITSGDNNIALGYYAGDNITTGSNNIVIGHNIDAPSGTASNQLTIGNLIFATGLTSTGTTVSTGSVGIGTASPVEKVHIKGGDGATLSLDNAGENLTQLRLKNNGSTGASVGWYNPSLTLQIVNSLVGPMAFYTSNTQYMTLSSTGSLGIGTATPASTLHVPDGKYAQFEDNNAGAPASGDCDANTERGRLSIDTTNNRLYVCNGATRGWDYIALTD